MKVADRAIDSASMGEKATAVIALFDAFCMCRDSDALSKDKSDAVVEAIRYAANEVASDFATLAEQLGIPYEIESEETTS